MIMAALPLKGVLQLFLILNMAYFLSAQFQDYPTARVPASWPYDYNSLNFTTSNSPLVMGIILMKEISARSYFACGFLSSTQVNNSITFAIGIVYVRNEDTTGEAYLTEPLVVWHANRNKPALKENATLQLLPDGDLVLRDVNGIVWHSKTSNKSVVRMEIMETGNLVLYNRDDVTVWQSFDHPVDTLLPGQKFLEGQKLVATVSAADWREGSFSFSASSHGLFAYYQSDLPQIYFNLSVFAEGQGAGPSYVKYIGGALTLNKLSAGQSEPDAVFSEPLNSLVQYLRFESDGHFRAYIGKNEVFDLLPVSKCDYPTVCGDFGICSNGQCTCPRGYENHSTGSTGCSKIIGPPKCFASLDTTICTEINGTCSHSLLHLKDVYHFSYVDDSAAVLRDTDVNSCKQACLKNCSCQVALFQYSSKLSHGNCFLPSPVLSLIGDGQERNPFQSSAFIRIDSMFAPKYAPPISAVIGSSLGALVIVLLVICIWIVFWRKKNRTKKNTEEDGEDHFDQVSGMPIRFSYSELKVATGDFQKKLGEGGFGSVFEGSMGNGVQIAVKRLDGSGQGKKEFMAEVKTIGRIHHVNLVRLIGFCAENLHRLLVYEFMCNGSLDKWILHRNPAQPTLDWQTRRKIVLDISKGLAYLHEECRKRIVHLDIKPQNILLDENFRAKVSDFGLSKLIDRVHSHVVTTMRGTPGYMAPEWLSSVITEKVDVYSFGIVVMEMVCGRKNIDRSQPEECIHLLSLFMRKAKEDRLIDMVDKKSEEMQLHSTEVVEMMRIAAWCLQSDFTRRPCMSMVVMVLEGRMDIEADIDYSFSNPTTVAGIRREADLGATATLLPSILSGPR